jgi:YVTN family beta-propeller protein
MDEREAPRFGVLLTRYRMAAGLSQEQLAERAGLSSRGISDLERGARTRPHATTVHHLAQALGLSTDERTLFEEAAHRARGAVAQASLSSPPVGGFLGALPAEPLVGREEEQGRVRTVLDAVAGGTGQLLLLAGEPGVGKTRLAQDVMAQALERGFLVGTGRCYQRDRQMAYAPLFQALSEVPGTAPAPLQPVIRRRWESARRDVEGLLSDGVNAADKRHHLFTVVTDFVMALAAEVPVALLLDDLHWADDGTIDLLQHLAQTTCGKRVLLLGTLRDAHLSEEHPVLAGTLQDLARERLAERMVVRRLSAEETASLAAGLMGQETVADDAAAFIYRRTKGIPRFVEGMVHALGGRLELQGEIGAGAMGRVFAAYDTQTEQPVAAKLMLARGEVGIDALLRFQQEAAVLATLRHPNIVQIHDSFIDEHASCLIMELLNGQSLGQILHDGPLSLARAKNLASQVAAALDYAHAQHVIHRDIKPDNVMVLEGDQVKVTDFGIARILQPDTSLQTIATTGMRMGTPLYMAPEQIEGKKIDGRTDIYALGAMLYHMATGRPPFEGSDALAVAVKHLQEEPTPPSRVDPTIPADWDALILKAMAKDPAKRFQSAREIAAAVASLGEQPGSRVPPVRRRRWGAALVGTVALVAAVVTGVLVHAETRSHYTTLSSRIDAYLSGLATHGQFSGTVLVGQKGDVVLAKGYGLADRAKKVPNSPTTIYPASGVINSVTLAAGLKLEEQGKLHDQDRVCSYISFCPRSWKPMTVRMVLDGTSKLPDYDWGIRGNTIAQSIAICQGDPLTAAYGTKGPYKACTELVLGAIIQKVTGKPFAAAMRQLILGPAGMEQSGLISDQALPPTLARDYSGSQPKPREYYNDDFTIYSTANDIYRYDNALFAGQLLSRRLLNRMLALRGVVDPPDPGIVGARWGYKWKMGTAFGHQVIYTTGLINSFPVGNMRFPAREVTIVAISNDDQNDLMGIALHVAGVLVGAARASSAALLHPFVDPSKAIVATIKTPVGFGIAPSAGAVWVPGPPGSGSVARIDPRTNKVAATIRINDPAKMASGEPAITWVAVGHGQFWVTDRVHNAVARIDPATNTVVARIPLGIKPFGLTISGETLWADNSYLNPGVVRSSIARVDLRTQKVVATITNADTNIGEPYPELHATPHALWFPDIVGGTIKRLDPASNKVVASIQTGPQPTSLALGDAAIWVSNHFSNLVTHVDPATNSVEATVPLEGNPPGPPFGIDCCFSATAVGAGGVWTIAGSGNRTLVRIDPRTNEATAALTFPQSIGAIAVGDGSVWVGFNSQIDRLDPRSIP